MLPSWGVGYGKVYHQGTWIADVLYDMLHKFPSPAGPPTVQVNLYVRTGKLEWFVNKPEVTLVLVDGSVYPITIAVGGFPGSFSARIVPPDESSPLHIIAPSTGAQPSS